jgi:hypothetical protein
MKNMQRKYFLWIFMQKLTFWGQMLTF